MKKSRKLVGIALVVAILGVAAVGGVAFAQDDDDGYPFDFRGKIKETIAEILGISVEEYDAAVEEARGQVVDEALAEGWLTEDQAERMQERFDNGVGARGMRGMGFMGRGATSLIDVAAEKMGMSVQDLRAELQDGKSIADVAGEKGVDTQDIIDTYLAELETSLADAVAEGKITQKQADWQLQQATERAPDQLNGTWEGKLPGGRRPGRMWGSPGQSDA